MYLVALDEFYKTTYLGLLIAFYWLAGLTYMVGVSSRLYDPSSWSGPCPVKLRIRPSKSSDIPYPTQFFMLIKNLKSEFHFWLTQWEKKGKKWNKRRKYALFDTMFLNTVSFVTFFAVNSFSIFLYQRRNFESSTTYPKFVLVGHRLGCQKPNILFFSNFQFPLFWL